MKKTILLLICMIAIMSLNVFSANPPMILANETLNIDTNSFTIYAQVNETSNVTFFVSSDNIVFLSGFQNDVSIFELDITGLIRDSNYEYQLNFTSLEETTTINNHVTTENNTISEGITNLMIGLVTLLTLILLFSFIGGFTDISSGNFRTALFKVLIVMISTYMLGVAIGILFNI